MAIYLIDTEGPNADGVRDGIGWLLDLGGGTVYAESKGALRMSLPPAVGTASGDVPTDADLDRALRWLRPRNVTAFYGGKGAIDGPALLVYPVRSLLSRVSAASRGDILVIGWNRSVTAEWSAALGVDPEPFERTCS